MCKSISNLQRPRFQYKNSCQPPGVMKKGDKRLYQRRNASKNKGKSLQDILVKAKLWKLCERQQSCRLVNTFITRVLLFCARKINILKQMKKPTSVIWEHSRNVEDTLLRFVFSAFPSCFQNARRILSQCNTGLRLLPDVWQHSRNVENTCLRLLFSTFSSCSQMPDVFYHSVIHSLGFFIC